MTPLPSSLIAGVTDMRVFLPARDYDASLRFYQALGFTAWPRGDSLASMQLGSFKFLLQKFHAEGHAANFMMQLLVTDLDAWWQRIDSLALAANFGTPAPRPPAMQPWGLRVVYVVDPSGVLWHIAEERKG